MSVSIPQPFRINVAQPFRTKMEGLPDTYHLNLEKLPDIHLSVDELPTLRLNVEQIPKIQLGVDPVEIRLTEFPSIRGHLPANFSVGLSILGMELMNVHLCGEAQVITEPYRPNPCEVCAPRSIGSVREAAGDLSPVDPMDTKAKKG